MPHNRHSHGMYTKHTFNQVFNLLENRQVRLDSTGRHGMPGSPFDVTANYAQKTELSDKRFIDIRPRSGQVRMVSFTYGVYADTILG